MRKPFKIVFTVCITIIIGLGVYDKLTNTTTGGVLRDKYGNGETSVSYGANELFILACILIIIYLFNLSPAKSNTQPLENVNKSRHKHKKEKTPKPLTINESEAQ